MKSSLIIAIDGPAGSGKSTTARLVAKRLGVPYIDTGAMYRALTLKAIREDVSFENTKALVRLSKKVNIDLVGSDPQKQKVFLDGEEVTKEIRCPELTKKVFYVAQVPAIRREMVKKQRVLGQKKGAVLEGRDIGTVVFPNASYKFYVTAADKVRARRRYQELKEAGSKVSLDDVFKELKRRDETDFTRKEGPLRQAPDAFLIDTTSLTIEGVVGKILGVIQSHVQKGPACGNCDACREKPRGRKTGAKIR